MQKFVYDWISCKEYFLGTCCVVYSLKSISIVTEYIGSVINDKNGSAIYKYDKCK